MQNGKGLNRVAFTGRWLGPALFGLVWFFVTPEGLPDEGRIVLALTCWIATWWITEAIPIPVTSLLPLIFFPLFDTTPIKTVAQAYINPIMFLFIGGFILALAMEKWNLHRRIALNVIAYVGTNARRIVLGFMLATGLISMWISNTATTLMMVPIALAIVGQIYQFNGAKGETSGYENLGKILMLGIAYASSIGGLATLVGTPTNLIFTGYVQEVYHIEITFSQWIVFGLPVSIILLAASWWLLVNVSFPLKKLPGGIWKEEIRRELQLLGPIRREETVVLVVFGLVAIGWISSEYLIKPLIPGIHDSMIALTGAVILFMIPSKENGQMIMDWPTALRLPWGILLLFGGAFAVADSFESTGLAGWMADRLAGMQGIPFFLVLLILVTFVNFLTELAQNMAVCTLMMPVIAALAPALDVHPIPLMAAVCMASSCAFMLPFATAPNVIVFGSGQLEMKDMIRAGVWLNIVSTLVIVLYTWLFLGKSWEMDLMSFPEMFRDL
ncbi:MAG: DASS family sodium-coupled anion symporter [Bacteroidia bacterium]|nr:DASS family sodium-coupled anion symporter [Bacteroidia bacterium]